MKVETKWAFLLVIGIAGGAFVIGLWFEWLVANFPLDTFRVDLDDIGHVVAWGVSTYIAFRRLTVLESRNREVEEAEHQNGHEVGKIIEDLRSIEERLAQYESQR